MPRTLSKQSRDQITAIIASARRGRDPGPLPGQRAAVLRAYCEDVSENDLLSAEPEYLATAILSHLSWGRRRTPGRAKLRIFNPDPKRDGWSSDHTIIQAVNDNMPFLIDSMTMRLNELGRSVHRMMHPLLSAKRTRRGMLSGLAARGARHYERFESYIQIEIGKELDESDLARIEAALTLTLADVRAAVDDWPQMLSVLREAGEHVRQAQRRSEQSDEAAALIDWLADDHFTLLGYRRYSLRRGKRKDALVPVAGTGLGILRDDAERPAHRLDLVGGDQRAARARLPLLITKSRNRSTVHRSAYMDQISVKCFGERGNPIGVDRFVGLFTSTVYNERPLDIPMLRLKVAAVMRESSVDPKGHRGKALQHILDTLPRDDLFQISISDLARISFGILDLQERRQVRVFCRRDALSRFFSCFVYLPRDHYTAKVRRRIEQILLERFSAEHIESKVTISESILARVEATIRCASNIGEIPPLRALEAEISEAVTNWDERLRSTLLERFEETRALELLQRFSGAFPASYQDEIEPAAAVNDIEAIDALLDREASNAMALLDDRESDRLVFRIRRLDEPIPLFTAAPILERMGVDVHSERVYQLELEPYTAFVQEFDLAAPDSDIVNAESLERRFTACFEASLDGRCEIDRFNAFVLWCGVEWRDTVVLRAYAKHQLQAGTRFSLEYMQQVLARDAEFTRALIDKFHAHFDPDVSTQARNSRLEKIDRTITAALDRASSLDEDRIMRAFLGMVNATLRTNFYQLSNGEPKPYLAVKLDPSAIAELPEPRPMFEIFVFSPRLEGVHLRGGRIARGGLRWSERREDFRTEILGLMKAQQVKNTIIVPNGAKGGFVCKRLPSGDRDAIQAEVVACYDMFVSGLLDVTDNFLDDGVVGPERVVRRDGDDPYLVVAADKGTATFSDRANAIAADYGFWLGDAFASGGSAGYDHKKMGITARGAWESVKRHFREIGIDPACDSFTAIGIGDMSGDVFGNGLLLSPHVKLLAAFNHRHIFIDPDPDPAASFAERRRLFELATSSWEDYSPAALSEGGSIYSRQSKSIEIHPNAQQMLGVEQAKLTPPELIKAILRAPVELLWNGGVGTYVKASTQSHADAGDPANDAVRIDATELRCKLVAEGGNLGLTQRARIEFALRGGRVNADFIDNAGGVDSSDREVNIKILLAQLIQNEALQSSQRNRLLKGMTDELIDLVLESNYAQALALSVLSAHSTERLGQQAELIRNLERRGRLNRKLEALPSDEELNERAGTGNGLTRPELAVIFSYAKLVLTEDIVDSRLPDDAYFDNELTNYFPRRLRERYADQIPQHRLHREIVAMRIANQIVNRMGPAFAFRTSEDTGVAIDDVVRAFVIVRDVFSIRETWTDIDAADRTISTALQYELMFHVMRRLRHGVHWLLTRQSRLRDVRRTIDAMKPVAATLLQRLQEVDSGRGRRQRRAMIDELQQLGVERSLAARVAGLTATTAILDIINLVDAHSVDLTDTARIYFDLGQSLQIDRIDRKIDELGVSDRWQTVAQDTLRHDLSRHHRELAGRILAQRKTKSPRAALLDWLERHAASIERLSRILQEIDARSDADFVTVSVAIKEIGRLG